VFQDALLSSAVKVYPPPNGGDPPADSCFEDGRRWLQVDEESKELLLSLLAENDRLKAKVNEVVDSATEALRGAAQMQAETERANMLLKLETTALQETVLRLEMQLQEERLELSRAFRLISRVRSAAHRPMK